MLAPVLIWAIAIAGERRLAVVGIWTLITAAAFVDFIDGGAFPPGQLAAWALIVAAIAACLAGLAPWHARARPGVAGPREADGGCGRLTSSREAALGTLANGIRFLRPGVQRTTGASSAPRPLKGGPRHPWSSTATS